MNKKLYVSVVLCLAILACSGYAETEHADAKKNDNVSQVEAWLALQREGSQASLNKQHLSGPAMDNIHQRYLESFKRPIPERFDPGQFNRQ